MGDHVPADGEVNDLTTGQASYASGSATIPAIHAGLDVPLTATAAPVSIAVKRPHRGRRPGESAPKPAIARKT